MGGTNVEKNDDDHDTSVKSSPGTAGHLLESAWGLIANAWWGDWHQADADWRRAAESWRDAYHGELGVKWAMQTDDDESDVLMHSLPNAIRELAESIGDLVEVVRGQLELSESTRGTAHGREWEDIVAVRAVDHLTLVRDFVAERLRVTGDEADALPVKVVFREYRNWCYDRSLREDEMLPFTGVMKALGSMGITRTEQPQASSDHDEWSEFALTGVRLHD